MGNRLFTPRWRRPAPLLLPGGSRLNPMQTYSHPNRLWHYAALFVLFAAGLYAAVTTGSVSGRILNVGTGQYLNNARVAVKGTELVAFTDQTGSYRLAGVPAGSVVLEVFYTGLDAQQITVTVPPGRALEQDVELTNASRYGADGTVKLDSFVVATSRETDGEAIAINEQRFAPNIRSGCAR